MIYWQLFVSFFQIGLFSFGGGYAAMPLIRHQVVELHPWLTATQFTDIVTISQMTPGPIAVNSATFVGMQIAGLPGAVVATLGCVAPACVIVTLLAWLYYRYRSLKLMQGALAGLRPAVVAMIASAGVSLLVQAVLPQGISGRVDWVAAVLFAAAFAAMRWKKPNPIGVMVCCGAAGLVCYSLMRGIAGWSI